MKIKAKAFLRPQKTVSNGLIITAFALCVVLPPASAVAQTDSADTTNSFPTVPEVLGGRTFDTFADRDVFFLRAIHDRYAAHWPDLLEANLTVKDYVLSPEKLHDFIDRLGDAMRDRNDPTACADLAPITGDTLFYANTNVYHAEILQAAARALIKLGPDGRKALAGAFSESHYRTDTTSLEDLANVIGEERPADAVFVQVLSAAAFDFSTASGASYPNCTTTAVKNLLLLTNGLAAVQAHLTSEKMLDNPGRFQAVVGGIAAAHASELATNLTVVQDKVRAKLADPALLAGGYRDDLQELDGRITRTLAGFKLKP